MVAVSRPRFGAARQTRSGVAGRVAAALFVSLVVVMSAAVVAGQPSGAEDCVSDICPR